MLYLAEVEITVSNYGNGSSRKSLLRIVSASDEKEAESKVSRALTVNDPYGESVYVDWVALSECIE